MATVEGPVRQSFFKERITMIILFPTDGDATFPNDFKKVCQTVLAPRFVVWDNQRQEFVGQWLQTCNVDGFLILKWVPKPGLSDCTWPQEQFLNSLRLIWLSYLFAHWARLDADDLP